MNDKYLMSWVEENNWWPNRWQVTQPGPKRMPEGKPLLFDQYLKTYEIVGAQNIILSKIYFIKKIFQ